MKTKPKHIRYGINTKINLPPIPFKVIDKNELSSHKRTLMIRLILSKSNSFLSIPKKSSKSLSRSQSLFYQRFFTLHEVKLMLKPSSKRHFDVRHDLKVIDEHLEALWRRLVKNLTIFPKDKTSEA